MGSVLIDGHKYSTLENIYKHESVEFFHQQTVFARHYRESHDNMLPHTLFWDYLKYKYEINPHRFTHYHPRIGHWFKLEPNTPPIIPTVPKPPHVPVIPNATPEPGSIWLFGIALIITWIARKFSK